jgi:hypothetical protein
MKKTTNTNPIKPANNAVEKDREDIKILPNKSAGTLTIPPNQILAILNHLILF